MALCLGLGLLLLRPLRRPCLPLPQRIESASPRLQKAPAMVKGGGRALTLKQCSPPILLHMELSLWRHWSSPAVWCTLVVVQSRLLAAA